MKGACMLGVGGKGQEMETRHNQNGDHVRRLNRK